MNSKVAVAGLLYLLLDEEEVEGRKRRQKRLVWVKDWIDKRVRRTEYNISVDLLPQLRNEDEKFYKNFTEIGQKIWTICCNKWALSSQNRTL